MSTRNDGSYAFVHIFKYLGRNGNKGTLFLSYYCFSVSTWESLGDHYLVITHSVLHQAILPEPKQHIDMFVFLGIILIILVIYSCPDSPLIKAVNYVKPFTKAVVTITQLVKLHIDQLTSIYCHVRDFISQVLSKFIEVEENFNLDYDHLVR